MPGQQNVKIHFPLAEVVGVKRNKNICWQNVQFALNSSFVSRIVDTNLVQSYTVTSCAEQLSTSQHNKHTDSRSQLNIALLTHNTRHAATAQQAHQQPVSTEHRTTHTQHTTCCHSTTSTPTAGLNWTSHYSHTTQDMMPQHQINITQ